MINQFRGEHRFLSNFFLVNVEFEGERYPSVEHAYQAAKTLTLGSNGRVWIQKMDTPGKAKRAGRQLVLRPDWEQVKLSIMEELLRHKFSERAYPVLALLLKKTDPHELVEGNNWGDCYWGMCYSPVLSDWVGENHLGKLLMKIRSELL